MNFQILINAIVRQTTILIAQLATAGGIRSPLAHIANQVFVDLASELERQGISRKVTADMFGITLRAYQRKVLRLKESSTERGRSLWEAVLTYVKSHSVITRLDILEHFYRDDEETVRGILRDLVKGGILFCSGTENDTVYRLTTNDEINEIRNRRQSVDELLWAIIFREDPIKREHLLELVKRPADQVDGAVNRLINSGRVRCERLEDGIYYTSESLVIPEGAAIGWEASVFDHFQAVVKTICHQLEQDSIDSEERFNKDRTGGSTYTFDIGVGHPLEAQVLDTLRQFRDRCSDLRRQVNAHNQKNGHSHPRRTVVVYAGQCIFPQGTEDTDCP